MSNSDLTLDVNGLVRIEGDVCKVEAYEIQLDNTGRRSEEKEFPRRALVHAPGDGLVINWGHDYPGGVTVNGPLIFPDGISGANKDGGALKIGAFEIQLDNGERRSKLLNLHKPRRALVHDFTDGLTLNWDRDYPGGVRIKGTASADEKFFVHGPLYLCQEKGEIPLAHEEVINGIPVLVLGPDPAKLAAERFGGQASDYEAIDVFRELSSLRSELAAVKAKLGMP